MKILESYTTMAKSLLLEDDDDRYVHIGYGKYKEKDSRTGEPLPNSPVYIKTDAGKYIMPDDDEKGGEEEPKGGGMGSGDFERDFGDGDEPKVPAPDSKSDTGKPRVSANPYDDNYGQEVDDEPKDDDWGPGATDDPTGGQPGDKVSQQVEDESKEVEGKSEELAKKYGLDAESDSLKPDEELYFTNIVGKNAGDYGENRLTAATYNLADYSDEATGIGYAINIGDGGDVINFDSKEEMMKGFEKVVADKKVQHALNKGEITDIEDHVRKIAGGEAVFGKSEKGAEESITINGKQYRPIKESKQHILKENYNRLFRSLK